MSKQVSLAAIQLRAPVVAAVCGISVKAAVKALADAHEKLGIRVLYNKSLP